MSENKNPTFTDRFHANISAIIFEQSHKSFKPLLQEEKYI